MSEENKSLFWYRARFVLLIVVFLSPFIAGWLALYVFELKPQSGNYGELVQPVKKIDWPQLKSIRGVQYDNGFGRKWTFVVFARADCADQCRSNLYYLRQIRTLLGRDMRRMQTILVSEPSIDPDLRSFLADYPNLVVIDNYFSEALYGQFQTEGLDSVGRSPRLYLIDPDQNFMMHYPAVNDQNRILEDLRRLIKLSQIG